MTTASDLLRVALFGSPPSASHTPSREGTLAAFQQLENSLAILPLASISVVKATKALLDADLAHVAGTVGLVYGDATDANNDIYTKSGGSGAGAWTNTNAFHNMFAAWLSDTEDDIADLTEQVTAVGQLNRYLAPRVLGIGASQMQQNHFSGPSSASTSNAGELVWAQARYPYFDFTTWRDTATVTDLAGMQAGLAGETEVLLLARILSELARAPDVVIYTPGGNSVTLETAAATQMAEIQATVEYALATGAKVVLANLRPRAASSWPAGTKFTIWQTLNGLIETYATSGIPGLEFWDIAAVYDDGTGRPIAGTTVDGVHQSRTGAKLAGDSLVPILKRLIKPIYDIRPTGVNLVVNPTMEGAGGTAGLGVTGDVPTSWSAAVFTGGAASVVGDKDVDGYQTFAITPTGSGSTDEALLISRLANETVVPGLWYQGFVHFRLSDWDYWHENEMLFNFNPSTTYSLTTLGVHAALYVIPVGVGGEEFLAVSMPHLCLTGNTLMNTVFRNFYDGSGSGTGTLTIIEVGLMEVEPPPPLYNL